MVCIELQMINWAFYSDILRDVAVATNFVAKLWQNYLPPALITFSFRNGMGYRLADERIKSCTNWSTSCKKMVKIGSVVFELVGEKMKIVLQIDQNRPTLPNISTTSEPDFTNVSAFVDELAFVFFPELGQKRRQATHSG